jgi:hypothetical protein
MVLKMTPPQTSHPEVSADFVARLADRAGQAEKQRRLPQATIADYRDSGLARLLLPKRYGGWQAEFPEILEGVRLMAHGCTSSAWTLGFYTLHNWMLALFGEQAQDEVFADGPVLCPAPLAPTGAPRNWSQISSPSGSVSGYSRIPVRRRRINPQPTCALAMPGCDCGPCAAWPRRPRKIFRPASAAGSTSAAKYGQVSAPPQHTLCMNPAR